MHGLQWSGPGSVCSLQESGHGLEHLSLSADAQHPAERFPLQQLDFTLVMQAPGLFISMYFCNIYFFFVLLILSLCTLWIFYIKLYTEVYSLHYVLGIFLFFITPQVQRINYVLSVLF